jgi:hypothetical protein
VFRSRLDWKFQIDSHWREKGPLARIYGVLLGSNRAIPSSSLICVKINFRLDVG